MTHAQCNPVKPDIAQIMKQQVMLASVRAYADAAVESFSDQHIFDNGTSLNNIMERVNNEFKGSDAEVKLEEAFQALTAIIDARATANPKPGQIDFMVTEKLRQVSALHAELEKMVQLKKIPQSCTEQLMIAKSIATADHARGEWADIAKARKEAARRGLPS